MTESHEDQPTDELAQAGPGDPVQPTGEQLADTLASDRGDEAGPAASDQLADVDPTELGQPDQPADIDAPGIDAPGIDAPGIDAPGIDAPGIGVPDAGPSDPVADLGQGPPGGPAPPEPPPPTATPAPPPLGSEPLRPYRRIYRSRHDRKVGGVAGGLAEYFGIDPTLVRLAVFLLAFTGVGILVYIAAWLIVPEQPAGMATEAPAFGTVHRNVQVAAGFAIIALAIGIVAESWAVVAIALIGGGVWLLTQQPGTGARSQQPATGYAPQPVYAAAGGPRPEARFDQPPPPVWSPPAEPAAPPVPRPRQTITRTVLSVLAVVAGVGIAAAAGDWWDVSATRLLGVATVVIGIGVVAGFIRRGGARGLIPLGLLAALALIPVSAVDALVDDGVGDTVYRPASLAELEESYKLGIGELVVDLSRIDLDGETRSVSIDLGIGHVEVIVGADAGGEVRVDANVGELDINVRDFRARDSLDGLNVESGPQLLDGDNGQFIIDLHVGIGKAELTQLRDR